MEKENIVWNKILTTVLKMPGVKVDRIGFLRKELRPYCNQSRLQMLGSVRPYTVVSEQVIDKLARQCVRRPQRSWDCRVDWLWRPRCLPT